MSEAPKDVASLLPPEVSEKVNKFAPVLDLLGLGKKVEKDGAKKDTKAETGTLLTSIFGDKFTDLMNKELMIFGTPMTLGALLGIKKTEEKADVSNTTPSSTLEEKVDDPEFAKKIEAELAKYKDCPLTSKMIVDAAKQYKIPVSLLMSFMKNDSGYGTDKNGKRAIDGKNPGNVANDDKGGFREYATWEAGVFGCADNIAGRIKEFHAVYGDNEERTAQMLATNKGPDGKGFISDQGNYKKDNEAKLGAYMTAQNGPALVQKFQTELATSFTA